MDRAWVRLVAAVTLGAVVVLLLGVSLQAVMVGWVVTALGYVVSTWLLLSRMSPEQTKAHATREDPTHAVSLMVLVASCLASLAGVAMLLTAGAHHAGPVPVEALVGVLAVVGA